MCEPTILTGTNAHIEMRATASQMRGGELNSGSGMQQTHPAGVLCYFWNAFFSASAAICSASFARSTTPPIPKNSCVTPGYVF